MWMPSLSGSARCCETIPIDREAGRRVVSAAAAANHCGQPTADPLKAAVLAQQQEAHGARHHQCRLRRVSFATLKGVVSMC